MLLSIFTQLSELRKAEKFTKPLQGWELLEKMQISTAVKQIFRENKKVHWKKNFGYKKKRRSTGLALHRIPAHIQSVLMHGCRSSQLL